MHSRLGEFDEAIEAYQRALALNADLPQAAIEADRLLAVRPVPAGSGRRPSPWSLTEAAPVTEEAAAWALRLFFGKPPKVEEIGEHMRLPNIAALRRVLAGTADFERLAMRGQPYRAPLFLLAPPADPATPWRFEPPSLAAPVSQLCTAAQMESPEFLRWMTELTFEPNQHRKFWEYAYILSVMEQEGMLAPGKRALGFGVGREPMPSLLARIGLDVVASDAPPDIIIGAGWDTTHQHSATLSDLHYPAIVDEETFRQRVSFRPVDMNAISEQLSGFDVCWSSCCFEHLGSLKHGLDFVENSLATLKPGGLAVHTTEFNLDSNTDTVEVPTLSIFRKRDFEALALRLTSAGHRVLPLNFHPGDRELDAYVDAAPFTPQHLKLLFGATTCTSFGIAVLKGAEA